MAGFLYFIPGLNQPMTPKVISERDELSVVLRDATFEHGIAPKGPDGGPGTIFCVSGTRPNLAVNRDTQTWIEVKGSHWLGYDNNDKPGPDDLRRKKLVSGTQVELGDGNKWIIPAVHFLNNSLPKAYRMVNGSLRLVPLGGFEEISEESDKWFEVLMKIQTGEPAEYRPSDLYRFFVGLLAINYRVGEVECGSGIDILTNSEDLIFNVLNAAFGVSELMAEAEQKKTASIA